MISLVVLALLATLTPSPVAADKCCKREFVRGNGTPHYVNCVASSYNIFAQCRTTSLACRERTRSGATAKTS